MASQSIYKHDGGLEITVEGDDDTSHEASRVIEDSILSGHDQAVNARKLATQLEDEWRYDLLLLYVDANSHGLTIVCIFGDACTSLSSSAAARVQGCDAGACSGN